MMDVPPEATWEMVPGVTDTDIKRWRTMAKTNDGLAALTAALTRQTTPNAPTTPAEAVQQAQGVTPNVAPKSPPPAK
jgi:hypothetical protein